VGEQGISKKKKKKNARAGIGKGIKEEEKEKKNYHPSVTTQGRELQPLGGFMGGVGLWGFGLWFWV